MDFIKTEEIHKELEKLKPVAPILTEDFEGGIDEHTKTIKETVESYLNLANKFTRDRQFLDAVEILALLRAYIDSNATKWIEYTEGKVLGKIEQTWLNLGNSQHEKDICQTFMVLNNIKELDQRILTRTLTLQLTPKMPESQFFKHYFEIIKNRPKDGNGVRMHSVLNLAHAMRDLGCSKEEYELVIRATETGYIIRDHTWERVNKG